MFYNDIVVHFLLDLFTPVGNAFIIPHINWSGRQPVGAVEPCAWGLPGHACRQRFWEHDAAVLQINLCCLTPQHAEIIVQSQRRLNKTTTDSPLELLQENSNVHTPLGAEDGNLGAGNRNRPDYNQLVTVAEIIWLLARAVSFVSQSFPNRQWIPKVSPSWLYWTIQDKDTVLHQSHIFSASLVGKRCIGQSKSLVALMLAHLHWTSLNWSIKINE